MLLRTLMSGKAKKRCWGYERVSKQKRGRMLLGAYNDFSG